MSLAIICVVSEGDVHGPDVSDSLITSVPVAKVRGTQVVYDAQASNTVTLRLIPPRPDIRVGRRVRGWMSDIGAFTARVTAVRHTVDPGDETRAPISRTELQLSRPLVEGNI